MITTVQMRIQNGTFRDHALEQGATVHEVAQYLRDEAAAALGRLNFRAVAVAVLSDSEISFPVEVRDPYAGDARDFRPADCGQRIVAHYRAQGCQRVLHDDD